MLPRSLWLAAVLALGVNAQSSDSSATSDVSSDSSASRRSGSASGSGSGSSSPSVVTLTGSQTSAEVFTGGRFSYKSLGSQSTASTLYAEPTSTSSSRSGSDTASGSGSVTSTSASRGSTSIATLLVGGGGIVTQSIINGTVTLSSHLNSTRTSSASGTGTSTSAKPTNTQPCNNYPEFCSRKYGNITEVCAHNSAFNKQGNLAANQDRTITTQLNDGIRMIQGQTHWENNTLFSCHTSCDILNAGTYLDTLNEVGDWVRDHPYDVVTILIGNDDFIEPGNYSNVLQQSNLAEYLYEPPYIPMRLDQWPTLSEMILSQKRVVVFMDYNADQTKYPYILDEFTHMWETPFSPTDRAFPCTTQRPPDLDQKAARNDLMYIANHNLNTQVAIFGTSLLIPNTAELNVTNSADVEFGSLGAANQNCTATWNRPPSFLLVDYYDVGDGSVFEVAAKANGVTYNRQCCGATSTSGASKAKGSATALAAALLAIIALSLRS